MKPTLFSGGRRWVVGSLLVHVEPSVRRLGSSRAQTESWFGSTNSPSWTSRQTQSRGASHSRNVLQKG